MPEGWLKDAAAPTIRRFLLVVEHYVPLRTDVIRSDSDSNYILLFFRNYVQSIQVMKSISKYAVPEQTGYSRPISSNGVS